MKQIFTISNQLIALGKRLAMVLTMLLVVGVGSVWGAEVTYVFKSKSWEATVGETEANWTSDKEGADFLTLTAQWEEIVLSNNCRWVEVIDNTILEDGDEVVITMTKGQYTYALPNTKNTSSAPEATPMDNIVGNRIANVADELKWTVDKKEGYDIFHSIKDATLNLYCNNADDGVRVGSFDNAKTNQEFSISGNYLLNKITSRYLGISFNTTPYSWRSYMNTTGVIKNQSLKFYKKTCLMSNEFWVDYDLANVVCVNPPYSQTTKDGSDLLLEFTAADGYALPDAVTVTNADKTWDKVTGKLTISNPTDNVTITITAIKRHTVNWIVGNNSVLTEDVLNNKAIQNTPSDPEDDDLGYCATKFMGWSEMDLGSTEGQSAPDDLCSAAEMKAKYTSLTEDKTFYAVFAGQEIQNTTAGIIIKDYAEKNNWSNDTKYTSVKIDENIVATVEGGGNTGKYYTSGANWRLYQTEAAKLKISAENDCKIKSLVITYATENAGVLKYNTSNITSGETFEINSNEIILHVANSATNTNGQVRISQIDVTYAYEKAVDYLTQCADLPTPTYAGPTIDKNELKVKCGDRSSMNSAATITFDPTKNYDLSLPITLTASEGFLLSTNKTKNDAYTTSVTVNPVKSNDNGNQGKITQNVYVRAEASADMKADYSGTITIESAQVATKTIDVTAIVTCTPHTLTFYNHDAKTKEKYYVGEDVQEPETPASPCEGYVFDGWSESIVEEGATTYSKVTFPYEMPNRNTILYAVYRISGGTYAKVTEALEDYSGEYLIVYENGNVAFDGGLSTLDAASNTISVEITDNAIASTTTTDAAKFTIAKVDGGYSIQSASGIYIGRTKDENEIDESMSIVYVNTISINNEGDADIVGTGGAYLRYNSASNQQRFRYYKSSSYIDQKAITFYKKDNRYTSYPDCTPPAEPEKPQALPATFSVSTTEKVQFSAGN